MIITIKTSDKSTNVMMMNISVIISPMTVIITRDETSWKCEIKPLSLYSYSDKYGHCIGNHLNISCQKPYFSGLIVISRPISQSRPFLTVSMVTLTSGYWIPYRCQKIRTLFENSVCVRTSVRLTVWSRSRLLYQQSVDSLQKWNCEICGHIYIFIYLIALWLH